MAAIPGDWPDLLDAVSAVTGDEWLGFLRNQRWFATKAAAPVSARVVWAAATPWCGGRFVLTRVSVDTSNGRRDYLVPIATCAADSAAARDIPAVAFIATRAGGATLFDAAHDPDFRHGIADALVAAHRDGTTPSDRDGIQWIAASGQIGLSMESSPTRLTSAEQSNTSFVVGESAIIKLFRLITPGIHPDVEVSAFLTARTFAYTPALQGTLRIVEGGVATTVGIAQRFVRSSTDAWTFALELSRPYFAGPAARDSAIEFSHEAHRLGAATRAFHEALAADEDSPDFAPEIATHEDLERWVERARRVIESSMDLLEQALASPGFAKTRVAEAQALARRRATYLGRVDELAESLGDDFGMLIRTHGDYHLGQVLRVPDGSFMVIDFEGEPSKPVEERRAKTSPLRDVAGMLRSVGYASAVLAAAVEKTTTLPTRELRAARWERDVRAAFLGGYAGESDDDAPGILPEEPEHVAGLIALFEIEKAFYELGYELNSRPSWAWIPMRGIAKLLAR